MDTFRSLLSGASRSRYRGQRRKHLSLDKIPCLAWKYDNRSILLALALTVGCPVRVDMIELNN